MSDDNQKNPFSSGHKGLSEQEKREFAGLVKQNEKKRSEQEKNENMAKALAETDFSSGPSHLRLIENRKKILESYNFGGTDQEIIEIMESSNFKNRKYLSMFYAITSFDHKAFVEKLIAPEIALQGKFIYVLGNSIIQEVMEESKKSVFYNLSRKLFDFMQQSYSSPEYRKTEILNHYLAIIGSLAVAVPFQRKLLENNFTLAFKPDKIGQQFCMVIPPEEMEKELFKELYDFYYKNVTKVLMHDLSHSNKFSSYKSAFADKETDGRGFSRLSKNLGDYDNVLSSKLSNLKMKGGGYY